jgi:hypothetical protein
MEMQRGSGALPMVDGPRRTKMKCRGNVRRRENAQVKADRQPGKYCYCKRY